MIEMKELVDLEVVLIHLINVFKDLNMMKRNGRYTKDQ